MTRRQLALALLAAAATVAFLYSVQNGHNGGLLGRFGIGPPPSP